MIAYNFCNYVGALGDKGLHLKLTRTCYPRYSPDTSKSCNLILHLILWTWSGIVYLTLVNTGHDSILGGLTAEQSQELEEEENVH